MKQIIQKIGAFPYYVFGIILFFLTHGYSENFGLISLTDLLFFFVAACIISLLILLFFRRKLRSILKAGIITNLVLVFYLFYGAFQNAFKNSGFLFQFSRYRILLPGMIIVIIASYFLVKKSSKDFKKITIFANTLFALLIIVDLTVIAKDFFREGSTDTKKRFVSNSVVICDSCPKPDIYLIVMDEYWGNNSLKKYFNYDNQNFTSFLKNEGFFVATDPFCNYKVTPLSMAATFNMKYIDWLNGRKQVEVDDYGRAAKAITQSATIKFLTSLGYTLKNYSIFDISDQPSQFNFGLLPIKLHLITTKTLVGSIEKDLLWHMRVKVAPELNWLASHFQNKFKESNNRLLQLTIEEIPKKSGPKFVYCHLMMPHLPHIYDSTGRENGINFYDSLPQKIVDNTYLSYLVYTNKVVSKMIDKIMETSDGKAVIIVMSDHGYRSYDAKNKTVSAANNFNAVFLPKNNYSLFYDSMSNVNQFAVLFNTIFKQKFPLLRDSVAF